MDFTETRLFTRKISSYLSDDEYQRLQVHMLEHPDAGEVIKGSGGIRKLRWAVEGKGKRGGIRVIYFLYLPVARILMLTVYAKNELEDLSQQEIKLLRKIVEEWSRA